MKKVLLIALGLVMGVSSYAQESEASGNKMWIGGVVGFNSNNDKDANDNTNDVSTFSYAVGPTFGYMLNEQMGVGINTMFTASTATRNNSTADVTKNSGYNFEPFFRYYFAGTGNFKFYGDLGVSFGGGKTTFEDNTGASNESKYGTFGVNVYPGMQYWFNDNWSMASTIGLLGYNSRTNNKGETDNGGNSKEKTTSDFGLNANFSSLKFAFFYHF